MKIQILGTGCSKCKTLGERTIAAAEELNLSCEIEKVTDIAKIMSFGVMATPALVVDGKVKCVGKVPALNELKDILTEV
ncbi:MAG: thioredoxin family protein [Alphaproteobacteria bacterium]|nr:thioredoxin family protein [Alphaproteobacteria bacterium]